VRVRLWGVRGSIPVPGAAAAGYGGNTSCVQLTAGDGHEIILDAGTGIRALGGELAGRCRRADILLSTSIWTTSRAFCSSPRCSIRRRP
jgi:phosphoribosyl 1,2-cyclic phosphodiesterase